jgi:hypothetical protein
MENKMYMLLPDDWAINFLPLVDPARIDFPETLYIYEMTDNEPYFLLCDWTSYPNFCTKKKG